MTVAIDASVVAAVLIDSGAEGQWARQVLSEDTLIAPHIVYAECASILRLAEFRSDVTPQDAALAYTDLLSLRVGLLPYEPFAQRVWALRANVTPYDAWYVAIAEAYDAQLATLDRRLAAAPGPRCKFLTPPV